MRFFVLILSFISLYGFGQAYKAGDILLYYYDVVPDSQLTYSTSGGPFQNYYFDVNGDSQNDIIISAYSGNGGAGGDDFIRVSTTANAQIRFERTDSVYNNFYSTWWLTNVADTLKYGDTINAAGAYWYSNQLDLTNQSYYTGAYKNVHDWVGSSDLYIGLRYLDTADTIYGWIRVNCPIQNKCFVKDYSYSKVPNGIQDHAQVSFNIWPNPVDNLLTIESPVPFIEAKLYDIMGNVIREQKAASKTLINAADLAPGVYQLQMIYPQGIKSQKIIVQH